MTPRQRAENLYREIMRIDTPGDSTEKWIALATFALQAQSNDALMSQRERMERARRQIKAAKAAADSLLARHPSLQEDVNFQDVWVAIDNAEGTL